MIKKKNPQINHVEEIENVKWCVFKVPQYTYSMCVMEFAEKLTLIPFCIDFA